MPFAILTDDEFLAMVADRGQPEGLDEVILDLRHEGRIQIFDDGTGDPLIIKLEQTN